MPPAARRLAQAQTFHGITLTDDYGWMRAANWQEVLKKPSALPAEIAAHLRLENAYGARVLAPTRALQATLVAELRGRIKEDDADVPQRDGPYDYYERYAEAAEHECICRRPAGGGDEQVLLDGQILAAGRAFFEMGTALQSPDHKLMAWSLDDKGSEFYTLRIRALDYGADFADTIVDTDGSAVWSADSRSIFYVKNDANHRPSRVYRHRLGSDPRDDALLFEELDPAWFVHIRDTQSGRFLVVTVRDHDSSESHLLDLESDEASLRLVEKRAPGLRYDLEHHGTRLLIRTNADGAEDFKIVEAPLDQPGRAHWRDVVAHKPGCLIVTGATFRDFFVRLQRENGLPAIVVRSFATGAETSIAFDEEAYALGMQSGFEFDTQTLRFTYSSMTTPEETYDFDMRTGARVLRKRDEIPSGHDPSRYVTRRIFARADDGESVPISILHRRDCPLDGTAPVLLYGYGSYGYAMPASFSANRLSLVDRGFVHAIAHVRGGTDKGWRWYADGKLGKKHNTFTDFTAAARALIAANMTSAGRIVAQGGSAGGLLMGAVVNLAPELFAGIIADVPFVDALNTILDDTLPLTPPEWLEWGNPITDRAAFDTIRAYSPYDNVRATRYPPILALGGLTDPRVTYWEPAKWVAKLRATMTAGGPVLLQTNMKAGHGGASGRFDQLAEVALQQAFAIGCAQGLFDGAAAATSSDKGA